MAYRDKDKEKAYRKAWRAANRNKIKVYGETYRENSKDKIKAKRDVDKEKRKAYNKAYGENNKDKIRAYCLANKDRIDIHNKSYHENNKDKIKARKKIWCAGRKEESRAYGLRYHYNLTIDDYNEMLISQSNSCAICKIEKDNLPVRLCVDHNHVSLKVRGLLCNNCNKSIGLFNDEPDRIMKAIKYIENSAKFTNFIYESPCRFAFLSMKETAFEKQKMLGSQNNKCGICEAILNRPCLDHDHKTNQVRGMLCGRCNVGLGCCKDSPDILQNMIEYLRKNDDQPVLVFSQPEETVSV